MPGFSRANFPPTRPPIPSPRRLPRLFPFPAQTPNLPPFPPNKAAKPPAEATPPSRQKFPGKCAAHSPSAPTLPPLKRPPAKPSTSTPIPLFQKLRHFRHFRQFAPTSGANPGRNSPCGRTPSSRLPPTWRVPRGIPRFWRHVTRLPEGTNSLRAYGEWRERVRLRGWRLPRGKGLMRRGGKGYANRESRSRDR